MGERRDGHTGLLVKRIKTLALAIVLLGSTGAISWRALGDPEAPGTVVLATFNIEHLGQACPQQVENAARIIREFDLVAIQEVMNYNGGVNGPAAVKSIVSKLGDRWACRIAPEANGTESAEAAGSYSTFEFYAFIWNRDRLRLIPGSARLWDEAANPMAGVDDERQFDREPYIASFEATKGALDFTIITIHAASPDQPHRAAEIRRLATVYAVTQAADPKQNDVILCGDFNTSVDRPEWKDLKAIDTMAHVLTPQDKTTVNKKTGRLSKSQYDTFWFQTSATGEDLLPGSGRVVEAWKADLQFGPSDKPPSSITDEADRRRWHYGRVVSDHLPVTITLKVGADTDRFN
jgi:endonuclease/exonuclease/phosphatase family metal-dependent hydrolase